MRKLFLPFVFFMLFGSYQIWGQTWSSPTRLTWNSGLSSVPCVAADSGNRIHVVWHDDTPIIREIYYKRSLDGGTSWSGLSRLTWNSGSSNDPAIAADSSDGIHIVWSDRSPGNYDILHKRSTNSGASWSGITRLTWNAGSSLRPDISADTSSGIHIVWVDETPGNKEIYYKRSTDCGAVWSGITRLTWSAGSSECPAIAADSAGGVYVVWEEWPSDYSDAEIFFKCSTDSGVSWSKPTRLTWNDDDTWKPDIAVDSSSRIHVVWQDWKSDNFDIFYKNSTNGGAAWSGVKRLTWNAGGSTYPSIAVDSGNGIYVVWGDKTPLNYEIFYKQSTDVGGTWSGITRLTWSSGESYGPFISTDSGGGIHVTWRDDTPGNLEIYYKNRK